MDEERDSMMEEIDTLRETLQRVLEADNLHHAHAIIRKALHRNDAPETKPARPPCEV